MAYVTLEKFNLFELLPLERPVKIVGLLEPEDDLAGLYRRYLGEQGLEVHRRRFRQELQPLMASVNPDLLLVNSEAFEKSKLAIVAVRQLLSSYPRLLIVTVGFNTEPEDFKNYMSAGVASHINRKHSKPQDVATIVKTLLMNK